MTCDNQINETGDSDALSLRQSRPVEAIERLMDAVLSHATLYKLPARRFIEFPLEEIWLVYNGNACVYREQGRQLTFISTAPLILGVKNIFYPPTEAFIIEFQEVSEVWRIPLIKFTEIIDHHELWKELAHLMSFYFVSVLENSFRLIKRNDYEVIKLLIHEYDSLSEGVKKKTTLAKYIVEKGLISRSNTARILSILNKYGYITIVRGSLIDIDYLPEIL